MKQINLKLIITTILLVGLFLTGCNEKLKAKRQADNKEINVEVYSVDNGILHGRITCQWEDSSAIYRDGNIEYYKGDGVKPTKIPCSGLSYMNMNDKCLYYSAGTSVHKVDLNDMSDIILEDTVSVVGINVYEDEVLLTGYAQGNDYYAEVFLAEADSIEKVGDLYDYSKGYFSDSDNPANVYSDENNTYLTVGENKFSFNGEGYKLMPNPEPNRQNYDCETGITNVSPEHIAVYDGQVYLLLQRSNNIQGSKTNVDYKHKGWDEIISFDPETEKSKSIYKTPNRTQQIVSFSIENDKLFLLENGILYKSDLSGENKTELASMVGKTTLGFECVNGSLIVLENMKIIGIYE